MKAAQKKSPRKVQCVTSARDDCAKNRIKAASPGAFPNTSDPADDAESASFLSFVEEVKAAEPAANQRKRWFEAQKQKLQILQCLIAGGEHPLADDSSDNRIVKLIHFSSANMCSDVVKHLEADQSFFPDITSEWLDYAPRVLAERILYDVHRLIALTQEKLDAAAKRLVGAVSGAVALLNQTTAASPDKFLGISRIRKHWPVLAPDLGNKRASLTEIVALQKKIQLGRSGLVRRPRKRFENCTPIVQQLCQQAELCRAMPQELIQFYMSGDMEEWCSKAHALPELAKPTLENWFSVIWDRVLRETNGHPETHPDYKRFGESGRAKYARQLHREGEKRRPRDPKRSENIGAFHAIKTKLKAALTRMAGS